MTDLTQPSPSSYVPDILNQSEEDGIERTGRWEGREGGHGDACTPEMTLDFAETYA